MIDFIFDLQRFENPPQQENGEVDSSSAVASAEVDGGTKYYSTLQYAVIAVKAGGTIKLLKDVTNGSGVGVGKSFKDSNGKELKIPPKDFTIDFGGHTYTVSSTSVGSSGTTTQGFHLERESNDSVQTITFKNGTINVASGNTTIIKMLIQNYCNLKLEGMTIDGTNIKDAGNGKYVLSNNNGATTIDGTSKIIAKSGDFAFDVCVYKDYDKVSVNVADGATITGNVELSASKDKSFSERGSLSIAGGTFSGDIIVDNNALKTGALNKITISGGTFKNSALASASKYTVYKANAESKQNILAAVGNYWNVTDTVGTWYNFAETTNVTAASSAQAILTGVSEIGTDATYQTVESGETKVLALNGAITVLDSAKLAAEVGKEKGYKVITIVEGTDSVATVTTFEENIPITSDLYSKTTAKTLTAANNAYAVNMTGSTTATYLIGGAGADTLTGNTGNDTLTGGKGKDIFVYDTEKGGGADVITDYKQDEDKISLSSDYTSYTMNNNVVTLTFSSGKTLELQGIKSGNNKVSFEVDKTPKEVTFSGGAQIEGNTAILPSNYGDKKYTASSPVTTIDASKTTSGINLIGNSSANSIIGGDGDDTIDSKAGDDTLRGGKGADTFIYSGGKDSITDFEAGTDVIQNDSKYTLATSVSTATSALILNFDDNNTLTLNSTSAPSSVNVVTGKDTYTYTKEYGTDNNKGVTLYAAGKDLDATTASWKSISGLVSIDGSAATNAGTLKGNSNANYIVAGTKGSTMDGGAGNDTLVGGNSVDTFVYSGGKDVFQNFSFEEGKADSVSLSGSYTVDKITEAKTSGSKTTFTFDKSNTNTLQINGFDKDSTLKVGDNTLTAAGVISKNTYKLFANSGDAKYTADSSTDVKAIDASDVTSKVTLVAAKDGGTLVGGAGKDTFVYNGGAVSIGSFGDGDKISLGSDLAKTPTPTTVTVNGDDVILAFTESNKITLGGAKGMAVDFINGDTMYFHESNAIFNNTAAKATAVTVLSGNFSTASNYDKLKTITAAGTYTGGSLTGNDNNDVITAAGESGTTLNGGGGSNTLTGGKGADVFVHETVSSGGKSNVTTIKDYANGDAVSISSVTSKQTLLQQVKDVSLKQKSASGTLTVKLADGSTIEITSSEYGKSSGNGKVAAVNITGADNVSFGTDAIYNMTGNNITGVNLMAGYSGKYDASSKLKGLGLAEKVTIDGSAVEENKKTKLHIIGTDKADSIIGGKAGKGNTLQGGGGDDTLTGTKGFKDTFYYSKNDADDDTVADFVYLEDTIKIDKSLKITNVDVSGGNVTFDLGSNKTFAVQTGVSDSKILFKSGNTLYWWDTDATHNKSTTAKGGFVTASKNGNGKKDLTSILKAFKKDTDAGFCVVNLDANIKDLIDKTAAKDATFNKSSGGSYTPTKS